jgi:hypothetical protein
VRFPCRERSNGVSAVVADFDDERIMWFEEPGCACGGNDSEQTFADFLARGPRFLVPPDDVLEELKATLQAVLSD